MRVPLSQRRGRPCAPMTMKNLPSKRSTAPVRAAFAAVPVDRGCVPTASRCAALAIAQRGKPSAAPRAEPEAP